MQVYGMSFSLCCDKQVSFQVKISKATVHKENYCPSLVILCGARQHPLI